MCGPEQDVNIKPDCRHGAAVRQGLEPMAVADLLSMSDKKTADKQKALESALQQIERTERVLKTLWRDQHQTAAGWTERYRQLANHSEQIRQGALTVLQHLLG